MIETSRQIPLRNVRITDRFFMREFDMMRTVMLPYQWEIMNDNVPGAMKCGCIQNFEIAAGLRKGEFYGFVFQDTDMAKWLEAAAYSLGLHPDRDLEAKVDYCVDLLEKVQWEDGYINTYFTLKEPEARWTNLQECHELYTAGHFIEAAVALYEATGKDRMLKILMRFADLICRLFGPGPDQMKGYPGHQELELALVRLYRVTGNEQYLKTAAFFINQRGTDPKYFALELEKRGGKMHSRYAKNMIDGTNTQSHKPVREQEEAVGHAVRAMYMYSAMADLAVELDDESLLEACRRLWNDIDTAKLYITGGIGSSKDGEQFTARYDLPNDSCYCETCASIGLALFSLRMGRVTGEAKYFDTVEKALYNNMLAGVSATFTEFYYVNPLEIVPEFVKKNISLKHVLTDRQRWFAVPCCPTNVARTLGSIGQYIYSVKDDDIYIQLYISSSADTEGASITMDSEYTRDGKCSIGIDASTGKTVKLRNPQGSRLVSVTLDGRKAEKTEKDGWWIVELDEGKHSLELTFDNDAHFMYANPKVPADVGKTCLQKGPFIYCFEGCDNTEDLASYVIDTEAGVREYDEPGLPGDDRCLIVEALKEKPTEELYLTAPPEWERKELRAVPYYLWNNREKGEMRIWLRYIRNYR